MTTIIIILLIVIAIVIIAYMLLKPNKKIEGLNRSYPPIPDDRRNSCTVFIDSFMDANINTRNEVVAPFSKWCNDYKKVTDNYPQYRSAEKVFLRMKEIYDKFYNF